MLIDTPIVVLMGHAGTGKTNAAITLALRAAQAGRATTLADLDTVNVYFRASDYEELLHKAGVAVEAPVLARTTLDTPSLSGRLDTLIEDAATSPDCCLVIDVGGDDDGATVAGRYARTIEAAVREGKAQVLYVVSAYRPATPTPPEAASLVPGLEAASRLSVTGILNTTNLSLDTSLAHVKQGRAFAKEVARLRGLPLVATVVPEVALDTLPDASGLEAALGLEGQAHEELLVAPKYVGAPW